MIEGAPASHSSSGQSAKILSITLKTKLWVSKGNDSVVRIIYNNDTSVKITVQVDNEENRHWQQVKEWVAEGNTIEEAD